MKPIEKAEIIREGFRAGRIPYEEARKQLAPIFKEMEEAGAEIAKRYGVKKPKFSITAFLR